MTLAAAINKVRKRTRTSPSSHSDTEVMERINEAQKEFAKNVRSLNKEEYVTITPTFDIQTDFAIRLTIVGGTNEIEATDIVICAADAHDQTGTQVAAALQVAIRAAITSAGGTPDLTVAWSTTLWKFTIDAIDSTSITIADPSALPYASALTLLGLMAATTTGTSVTGSIPTDCTVESALPTDFLSIYSAPEWNGDELFSAPFSYFKSPATMGTPYLYFIRNKRIMLWPAPNQQGILHIWYKYVPTAFTAVAGYQECGFSGLALDTTTGLSATTSYYFKVNIDGGGVREYSITTAALLTYEDVIDLLNDQLKGAVFSLVDGDLRCTSKSLGSSSSIALSAGTTGTNLFATLTGFSAFDTAVESEAGDSLDVDDEYADAVVYFAAAGIAEENFTQDLASRYLAQANRICKDFSIHRANNNTAVFPDPRGTRPDPKVDYGD
jgi:hypothetical protein